MNVNEFEKLKSYYANLYDQIIWINLLGKDLIYLFPKEDKYHKDIFGSQLFLRLIVRSKNPFCT